MRTRFLAAIVALSACGFGSSTGGPSGDDPLQLGATKHTATFDQRDTQTVPNTVGRLSIVVGDVEGTDLVESVELVDHKDDQTVLDVNNFRVGTTKTFKIDGTKYEMELVATDSSHILHDTATFEFSVANR